MNWVDLKIQDGWMFVYHPTRGPRLEHTDLFIHNGQIRAIGIGHGLVSHKTISAKGLLITPGFIDSQVHWREPGLTHKETIRTGSLASLMGGVTSTLEMPNTKPATVTYADWQWKMDKARHECFTHYGFYLGFSPESRIAEIQQVLATGHCPGVKVFLSHSFGELGLKNWSLVEKLYQSQIPLVAFHAEDDNLIQQNQTHYPADVRFHHLIRSPESAFKATQFIFDLAKRYPNTRTHILHITTAMEVELLSNAPKHISFELLPQHVYFEAPDCYERLGTLVQQNPPIRDRLHRLALLQAAQKGVNATWASDHAPHTLEEKMQPYPQSPSGMPLGQFWTSLLLTLAVDHGWDLKTILTRMTTQVADLFRMVQKGRIQPGWDADITFIDLNKTWLVESSKVYSQVKWTPLEGTWLKGFIQGVLLKGKTVVWDADLIDPQPHGEPLRFEFLSHFNQASA